MATILIGAIVFGCIGLAAYSVYKDKKQGSCSCGCAGCKKAQNGCSHH